MSTVDTVEVTHDDCDSEKRLSGAYRTSWGNTWFSKISHRGRTHYLGTFRSPEAAHEAYLAAKRVTAAERMQQQQQQAVGSS